MAYCWTIILKLVIILRKIEACSNWSPPVYDEFYHQSDDSRMTFANLSNPLNWPPNFGWPEDTKRWPHTIHNYENFVIDYNKQVSVNMIITVRCIGHINDVTESSESLFYSSYVVHNNPRWQVKYRTHFARSTRSSDAALEVMFYDSKFALIVIKIVFLPMCKHRKNLKLDKENWAKKLYNIDIYTICLPLRLIFV